MVENISVPRVNTPRYTDTQAMNRIAILLGSHAKWDASLLEAIADLVNATGRPTVGDQSEKDLAMYRRAADRIGYIHDGD